MLNITDKDFNRLVQYVKTNYGINLEQKRQLIAGRLSDVVLSTEFHDFAEYLDSLLCAKNQKSIEILLNKLTTNYTYFMREESHFAYFKNIVLPWLERTRKNRILSIWSAGCSTGQEPYTLSILLKEYFGSRAPSWDTRILATDISAQALDHARLGVYDEESLKGLPAIWRNKYFQKSSRSGYCEVTDSIKSNVIFRHFNLMNSIHFKLQFDVIFCRNVMIYFDQPTKDALIKRFYNATVPDGYLFIGHSENLPQSNTLYDPLMPSAYRKK